MAGQNKIGGKKQNGGGKMAGNAKQVSWKRNNLNKYKKMAGNDRRKVEVGRKVPANRVTIQMGSR